MYNTSDKNPNTQWHSTPNNVQHLTERHGKLENMTRAKHLVFLYLWYSTLYTVVQNSVSNMSEAVYTLNKVLNKDSHRYR